MGTSIKKIFSGPKGGGSTPGDSTILGTIVKDYMRDIHVISHLLRHGMRV